MELTERVELAVRKVLDEEFSRISQRMTGHEEDLSLLERRVEILEQDQRGESVASAATIKSIVGEDDPLADMEE